MTHGPERLRQSALRPAIYRGPIPAESIYPTASEQAARAGSDPIPFLIPAEGFRRITEKIVRGITFIESGRFIDPPHKVQFYALRDEHATELGELLDQYGTTLARGPGIVVQKAVTPEDGISGLFEIQFWGQFKTHAAVIAE